MARGPKYKVPRRRRREGKTNYYKRYTMILSKHPRFVIRKTNKYILVQVVVPRAEGDHTIVAAHSRELVKLFSWKGGTSNTPAAYLTGLLAAIRALKKDIKSAIPDIGLHRQVKGSLLFAAIKAANDVGLKVPFKREMAPSPDRITGKHIAEYARLLKEKGLLEARFAEYIKRGLDPEQLPSHFEEIKNNILKTHGSMGD